MAAVSRTLHLELDRAPWIFEDRIAERLAGPEFVERGRRLDRERPEASRWARIAVAWRARLTEDLLERAIRRGIRQYVILGAGLDSFAWRASASLTAGLRVFEVDHPATQGWKRARLDEIGISVPGLLSFVPIDFEREDLVIELEKAGFRTDAPAFVSWLGVTGYLSVEAIRETLRAIAAWVAGSELAVTYEVSAAEQSAEDRRVADVLGSLVASAGEPRLSRFDPPTFERLLREAGFTSVSHYGPSEASREPYFQARSDGLTPQNLVRLAHAVR